MVANKKYTGIKLHFSKGTKGTLVDSLTELNANAWYKVASIGGTEAVPVTALPAGLAITGMFKTPDAGETAITLLDGDSVYPYTLEVMCKTDGELSAEEGTVDVTTDCDGGYIVTIKDGLTNLSGSINSFISFNEETDEITTDQQELFGYFFDITTDDGAGGYTVTKKSDEEIFLFILLNKNAGLAQIQNYLLIPANITTLGTGAGLTDAQKSDVTWVKAPGLASFYTRTVKAGDVV